MKGIRSNNPLPVCTPSLQTARIAMLVLKFFVSPICVSPISVESAENKLSGLYPQGVSKSATEGDFTPKFRGFVNYPLVKNEPQKINNRSSQIASPPQTVNKPEARSHELAGTNTTSGVAPEPNPETKKVL